MGASERIRSAEQRVSMLSDAVGSAARDLDRHGLKGVASDVKALKSGKTEDLRRVTLFSPDMHPKRHNSVRTSKYTLYTFLPRNMYEQFTQLGNFYFLVMSFLQTIELISNSMGVPVMLVPLSIVVGMGGIKDLLEDRAKHLSDDRENGGKAVLLDEDLKEQEVLWHDVRPGMLLKVRNGERLPCDALLLSSSAKAGDGSCSVETMNLDGESNLKKKSSAVTADEWQEIISKAAAAKGSSTLSLKCEPPSVDLYQFRGAVSQSVGNEVGAGISNLLLRGTSIQQTEWVMCLAVFCGHESRIMMNQQAARFKLSTLDVEMGKVIAMIFALQFVLCVFLAVSSAMFEQGVGHPTMAWYLWDHETEIVARNEAQGATGGAGWRFSIKVLEKIGTWVLQTNNLVPISLLVTLTIVKYVQGVFVTMDADCGNLEEGRPARVQTSQVMESLGQITHVFSDKTGTLTKNMMVYQACSVLGRMYGLEDEDEQQGESKREPQETDFLNAAFVRFNAASIKRDLQAADDRSTGLATFFLCHALCHTIEISPIPPVNPEDPPYNASSPDELALVCAARAMGLEFISSVENWIEIGVTDMDLGAAIQRYCGWGGGPRLRIQLLDICEFDNDRKRMSVVVRMPDGRPMLMLKGADSSVLPHIACANAASVEERAAVDNHLWKCASLGLRTLCLAARHLSEDEYADWKKRYSIAQADVSEQRAELVAQLAIELETTPGLVLLGATAIDDALQDEVAETIEQLRRASIRVWMLTGDKVETAISIGFSCKLLAPEMTNIVIEEPAVEHCRMGLREAQAADRPSLTITGAALAVLLEEPLRREFFDASRRCAVVLCCRVSPKQKADVVQLVKGYDHDAVSLSIGDGANDVSMIVAAHVGVGVCGKEGAQAANTADFAIAEFRFLRRLLFVHGRESYRRMAVLILFNFYKNCCLVLPLIFTANAAGFSGQSVFHPLLLQVYNILFTHWPICAYSIFDRSVHDLKKLEFDPRGWAPNICSRKAIVIWNCGAALQTFFLTTVVLNALRGRSATNSADLDGHVVDPDEEGVELNQLWLLGLILYSLIVISANLTCMMRHTAWFWFMPIPYFVNFLLFTGTLALFVARRDPKVVGIFPILLLSPDTWRVMVTSILGLVGSMVIGEGVIRNYAEIVQWIDTLSGADNKIKIQPDCSITSEKGKRSSSSTGTGSVVGSLPSIVANSPSTTSAAPRASLSRGPGSGSSSSLGFALSKECAKDLDQRGHRESVDGLSFVELAQANENARLNRNSDFARSNSQARSAASQVVLELGEMSKTASQRQSDHSTRASIPENSTVPGEAAASGKATTAEGAHEDAEEGVLEEAGALATTGENRQQRFFTAEDSGKLSLLESRFD